MSIDSSQIRDGGRVLSRAWEASKYDEDGVEAKNCRVAKKPGTKATHSLFPGMYSRSVHLVSIHFDLYLLTIQKFRELHFRICKCTLGLQHKKREDLRKLQPSARLLPVSGSICSIRSVV